MRIDKYLSQLKYGSRKEIKDFIKKHEIFMDHRRVVNVDDIYEPSSMSLTIDGVIVPYFENVNLAIYKPKGVLSANIDNLHPVITSLIKAPYNRLDFKMAGRLDIDAEGLMILTTDGKFVHEITHPKKHLDKTYEVKLDKQFTHERELTKGVMIKDKYNQPYLAVAKKIETNNYCVTINIDEGKFHQVKRMFESLGYTILNLKRTQIGNLKLNDLKAGEYYVFRKEEVK